MKKLSFVIAGLALVASAAFTSCEKDHAPGADEGLKSIALSINFGGVATKAVDDDLEAGFATGQNYTSLQIYFTDDAGNIKYAYTADKDSQDDEKTIWDNLTTTKGVKFIGLESVSGVYVTANAPLDAGTITYGGPVAENVNVSAINDLLKIENIDGVAANMMPYAGACTQLQTAGSSISGTAGEVVVGDGADGAEYLVADLTIRPAVSRFEVSKVGVKTSGTTYFKVVPKDGVDILEPCADSNDPGVKYSVAWRGFDAELIGIYMSNFYKESPLFPNKTAIGDWTTSLFTTPGFEEGTSPISGGQWTALTIDNAGISYANYNSGYGAFTTSNVGSIVGDTKYLFDGTTNSVVVPFNFFVPYSLTDKGDNADAVASFNGVVSPALHFQFRKPGSLNITCDAIQEKTSTNTWQDVSDDALKQQLQNAVAWPNSTDAEGIVYANVTKFLATRGDESSAITIKPGLIYKIDEVIVEPVNLSVSTKFTDQFNVYVVVKVVGFNVKNVYPSFD